MKNEIKKVIKENSTDNFSNGIILGASGKGRSNFEEIIAIAKNENLTNEDALKVYHERNNKSQ
ncbi:hypothetical protein [Chryseobacterium glaciei]|nr:hypothetical protein [Chryseobacterium glaciei]